MFYAKIVLASGTRHISGRDSLHGKIDSIADVFIDGSCSSKYSTYRSGFRPLAFAVSTIVYRTEFASAPATDVENKKFFLLCSQEHKRKNWLFSNTVSGAKASAVIYSIIETAKENNINPHKYLTWVFKNAPNIGKPGYIDSYDDLLPDRAVLPKDMLMTPIPPRTRRTHRELYGWDEDDDPLEVALDPEEEAD